MDTPVLYAFLLYFLFITFPLIPAIIIYKIFPNTQVGASGLMGQLKINATGAFAAYLITAVMSFFIVQYAQGIIMASSKQAWTVSAKIVYVDKEGKPIKSNLNKMISLTAIHTNPDAVLSRNSDLIKFVVLGEGRDIIVTFDYPNGRYETRTIDLSNDTLDVNETNRTINLGTLFIQETYEEIEETEIKVAETPAFSGPPITNNNE